MPDHGAVTLRLKNYLQLKMSKEMLSFVQLQIHLRKRKLIHRFNEPSKDSKSAINISANLDTRLSN